MKNFGSIQSTVIARAKIDPTDSTSVNLIMSDANDAISIVAAQRDWPQLYKSSTIALTASDGAISYNLAADVDRIEIMGISSPTNYAITLTEVPRRNMLNVIMQKTIGGTAQPTTWYFDTPTLSTDGLETKRVSFNVMPDKAYTITYWYRAYPPTITSSTNYPFFNQNFHHIIENYCLWKYAERNPDPTLDPAWFRGEWENGVRELLANYLSDSMQQLPIPGPNPTVNASVGVPPIK